MSSGTNNSNPNPGYRQPRQIYGGAYAPNIHWNDNPLLPRLLPFGATPNARGEVDLWWPFLETAITEPYGLTRNPPPLHAPVRVLVLNNDAARDVNPWSRQSIPAESPRRFTGQQNMLIPTQDESRLTQDEQKTALKKLKKEIYNPTPKRIIQNLSLYYRDNARNNYREKGKEIDEDSNNCAICLEAFEPRKVVMLTPCSHMFHEECIVPWVKSHGQCPVCRFALFDRIRESSVASDNNPANMATNEPFAGELISVIRAMEEAFDWRSSFQL